MILLVHMLFGSAIGYTVYSLTNQIWLSFLLAFLSHYFLDLFPHIEYLASTEDSVKKLKSKSPKEYLPDLFKVIVDFLSGILLIYFVSIDQPYIYFCAIIAILPDGLTVINSLFEINILKKHHYFHGKIIHFLKYKKISKFWRISTQATAFIISIYLLLL
ncbi:MAG: hypothetical protein FJZ43_00770 [Candidatus Staskawiczbacteria bacterium]|nr:hypothetical protein [Candidatus Staskawiczbacteria bacterium]